MKYRKFGTTDLEVSEVGFGAWAIGGPAMAGGIPIGWGDVDDKTSVAALHRAFDQGINFYDTADFYGLGHSEELIGKVFGNRKDLVIATKVGHRLDNEERIYLDYSKEYILESCEQSLRRLKRDTIDFYQLHSARMTHFEEEACVEAMQQLVKEGKIRYWGLSLNTFAPAPEADFMMGQEVGHGFQLVLNMINQRAVSTLLEAEKKGYGTIIRMPLQFGLLTGKFTKNARFGKDDHRSFRLNPEVLEASLDALGPVWKIGDKYGMSKTELAMSFILSFPEVSTVIPGIKTPEQVDKNTSGLKQLEPDDHAYLVKLYDERFCKLMELMAEKG